MSILELRVLSGDHVCFQDSERDGGVCHAIYNLPHRIQEEPTHRHVRQHYHQMSSFGFPPD